MSEKGKMMKNILVWGALICAIYACGETSKSYEQVENGVVVYPTTGSAKGLKVTFVTDDIVKVEASATTAFDTTTSLVAVPEQVSVPIDIKEADGTLTLATDELIVTINQATGQVSYADAEGNPIMSEQNEGRAFEAITVEGKAGYTMSQKFDSPEDEGIYGLGQHQADEMNYKGKNEELFQYNTKVSIPFVMSTENYGILWDNYSLTRYGDERPYTNIDQFKLYDKTGKEGGLTATYYDDQNSEHVFVERVEDIIDYENLTTVENFPKDFPFANAKIVWEGQIEGSESGLFRFLCYYAGYTKLWINGELQFEKWRTAWNPSVAKFSADLKKGEKNDIKLEWIPDGGVSYIGLKALSPVDEAVQKQIAFSSEMGQNIRYYFMAGDNMDDVISKYRTVTGKAQVMPKWSMGFWQSRERYKTQDELLGALGEFRKRHIPIDNIVLDWSYWPKTEWGSHDFDLERFPDITGMIDKIHEQNARVMISVWPKFYHNTEHYKQFDAQGWMYKRAVEDSVKDWIYPGYIGSFYDAYSSGARKMFWDQIHDKLYTKGFDAWWMDASEPDILSNASIKYRKELSTPTALGPSTEYFNAYALQNAKGIYEGQRSVNNDERVFILTRSGFAGIQRFGAVTWSGDIGTRWEDMKAQISAGINFAMSGLPYWTMDVGGFCVEKRYERATEGSEDMKEWRELNTRWFQFGAFVPLFRVHGQYPFREVYNLAPETHPAYKSMLYYNKLRYKMMPYIYSLAGWTYTKDYTIMRGLAMDFSADKKVYEIGDQFMFGPSLMACPVYVYGARDREVYLPKSAGWYDAYSGEYYTGGQTITAQAEYERMPLFAKAGSIVTFGPEIEYTTQKPADPITVVVYAGADASFDLYEDEGTNYNYESGKFTSINLKWSESAKTLTIGEREGSFDGMLENRTFRVKVISKDNKGNIDDLSGYEEVKYSGQPVSVKG
ncbi:TIM-barrel domain-containing protein [Reichenbachiella sp. MSK19-1]|uniref:TIM-barrel domain-containing protein n=1 Tax=Reichenbachiella sp. MSK19-1 TaxID=1897631 RepID=UPI001C86CC03|nr:TIM-barrel domain-containing protein [Reichenbachiella sp. MSK19-1]